MPKNLKDSVTVVPSEAVPEAWQGILPGLKAVQSKAGTDDFRVIYRRLTAGEAFLFLAPEGFFVLLPVYRDAPSVLIWIAYGVGVGLLRKYMPLLEEMARDIGAEAVEIESTRPGYRRALKHWKRTGNRYIRRLT